MSGRRHRRGRISAGRTPRMRRFGEEMFFCVFTEFPGCAIMCADEPTFCRVRDLRRQDGRAGRIRLPEGGGCMKRRNLFVVIVLLLCVFALVFQLTGFADAGDFAGDSDFGGGDWGGSDWGGSDFDFGDSSSSGSGGSLPGAFVLVIIIVIVVLLVQRSSKRAYNNRPTVQSAPVMQYRSMQEFQAMDPNFSAAVFCEKIGNLYVTMQNCWQEKKWEPMRAHMTDALYNQFARQLDAYIRNRQTNHVDRIAVLSVQPLGFYQDNSNDSVVVRVQTRICDYVTDDATGRLVRGNPTKELFMTYEWTIIRSKGMKTGSSDGVTTYTCHSCGAPVDLTYSAKCEYCGTIMNSPKYDWVIAHIRAISQQSGR